MPLGTVAFARQDLKLSNKLRNGSFTEGFSGWRANSNVTDYYVDNGVLTFVGAGSLSTIDNWIRYDNPRQVFTEGEVVYNACWARSNELEAEFEIGTGYARSVYSLTSEFELCSYFGAITDTHSLGFSLGADTSKEVQVTNCIAISLTEVFGAGNEPTKEEMDTLIRQIGWFEGTRTLKQTETTNWLLKLIRENKNAIVALGGSQ